MANQIIIDIGAVANDGTGDPLRTAFGYVNDNFSNIWSTGVANSNVAFDGNRILTVNTNGNLVLSPNGVGKVQSNVDILPNANNTLSLGSSTKQWNTVYARNLNTSGNITVGGILTDNYYYANGTPFLGGGTYGNSNVAAYLPTYTGNLAGGNISITNNAVIGGNLTVNGTTTTVNSTEVDIVDKNITLAYGSPNAAVANGAGITIAGADVTLEWVADLPGWYTNTNLFMDGAIVPFTANTQQLGDVGLEWSAVYANTLYATSLGANITYGDSSWYFGPNGQLRLPNLARITASPGADTTYLTSQSGGYISLQSEYANASIASEIHLEHGQAHVVINNGTPQYWIFDSLGDLTTPGNIIPNTNNAYTLGNATNQWSDLYVSNATIYMNNVPLSMTAGNVLTINGEPILSNDSNTSINTTGNIFATNVTTEEWVYANLGVETQQIQFTDPFGISANNVNMLVNDGDLVYESTVSSSGGFRPSADNSESIGKDGYRWNTIYGNVINATTFIGDGSQLSNVASTGNIAFQDTTMYIAAGAAATEINISPEGEGWAYLQLPADATANTANTRLHNDAGNVEIATGDFSTGATLYSWYFDNTGNLTLPINGSLVVDGGDGVIGPVGDDLVMAWDNEELIIRSVAGSIELQADNEVRVRSGYSVGLGDYQYKWSFSNNNELVNITGDSAIVTEAGNLALSGGRDGLSSGNVTVRAVNVGVAVQNWIFDNTGNLTTPGDIHLGNGVAALEYSAGGNRITITSDTANNRTGASFTLNADANVYANANVRIASNNGALEWLFDNTGNLTVPGNIVSNDTILIDNRQSGVVDDISIYSADNILLKGADRLNPGEPEGGDINIYAGNGAEDNGTGASGGGDLDITAGTGGVANTSNGGSGGFIALAAGLGGAGSATAPAGFGGDIEILAGGGGLDNGGGGGGGGSIVIDAGDTADAAQDRGSITLTTGSGGNEITGGGYVQIAIPSVGTNPGGSWTFTGSGTALETPANAEIFGVNAGNLTVGSWGNTIVRTLGAGLTTYDWVFDPTGNLQIPGNGVISTAVATGGGGGKSVNITAGSADQSNYYTTAGGDVNITGGLGAFNDGGGGGPGGDVNITSGLSSDPAGHAGNVNITAGSSTWVFDYTGNLNASGTITATGAVSGQTLVSTQSAANEGGEITLVLPSSGSTLAGNIIIDSYQDWVRFFEGGGTSRGLYVDIPNVSVAGQYAIGYRDVPQIALSGNVTANSLTAGKHFYSTTAGNLQVTIPDNANVAFPTGATITIVVNAAGNVVVAQGTGVSLYMAGSSTTGNRAVGAYGLASVMKVATDTWIISGTGVY